MKQTDWSLVQAGDQETIEVLLHRHEPLVLNIVGRFAWSRVVCFDDLKQEGMIALWKAIASFDATRGTTFATWAYRWIFHAVSHEARTGGVIRTPPINKDHSEETNRLKQAARAVASLSEPDGVCQDVFFARTPDPAEGLENQEERYHSTARYNRLMNVLPPKEQYVVRAHLDGTTFKAIGVALGVSRARANQIWFQALKRLRKNGRYYPAEHVREATAIRAG